LATAGPPSTAGTPSAWWGANSSNNRDPRDETTAVIKTATVGPTAAHDTAKTSVDATMARTPVSEGTTLTKEISNTLAMPTYLNKSIGSEGRGFD
jgi:hypothetical protein